MTTFNEIHVRLVDGSTGKVLSESNIPAGSLPESIALGKTALKVSGQQWTVVRSDPPTRAEYLETGQLTLTLEPQAASAPEPVAQPAAEAPVPPAPAAPAPPAPEPVPAAPAAQEVLYPVPTKADGVPATVPPGEGASEYVMTKDDWRQVELISSSFDKQIEAEIYDIEGIVRDHSIKMGDAGKRAYKEIFMRKRIKTPISPSVPMGEISDSLPQNTWTYGVLGFHSGTPSEGADEVIPNSFAFDFGMCALYGQSAGGGATVIGLKFGSGNYGDAAAIAAYLDKIMVANSLVLVDWCWRRKFSGAPAIESYLKKKYAEQ